MAEYFRKPVKVDAVQFWPHEEPWPDGVGSRGSRCTTRDDGLWCDMHDLPHAEKTYCVKGGPEGCDLISVRPGDWIVTDWQGLRHVVPDAEFQLTYDAASVPLTPNPDQEAM